MHIKLAAAVADIVAPVLQVETIHSFSNKQRKMAKFMSFLLIIAAVLTLFHQCTALECYMCDPACEASKAKKIECGKTISDSQEAVCARIFPQGKTDSAESTRKCMITSKGQEPSCPQGSSCKFCKSDLCNAAPSIGSNAAMLALVTVCLAKMFV